MKSSNTKDVSRKYVSDLNSREDRVELLEPNPVHSARRSLVRGELEEEFGSFIGG